MWLQPAWVMSSPRSLLQARMRQMEQGPSLTDSLKVTSNSEDTLKETFSGVNTEKEPVALQPADGYIELSSRGFRSMREKGAAFVDKTGAIAELLCRTPPLTRRMFFARPRKFGKSLTLDVIAQMLAAGGLPPGVEKWSGYRPVAVDLFCGLAVHDRFKKGDPMMELLLQRVHFVIILSLGVAQSGLQLGTAIIENLGRIARTQFGEKVHAEVMSSSSPGSALSTLICAVPTDVPVAVLVDEYDAAIVNDVCKGHWKAAEAGLEAVSSLLMTSKSLTDGERIHHFVVTGVARFTGTSLFSGANNFEDLTAHPLMNAALGFFEEEIRRNFGGELERLGRQGLEGKTIDETMAELRRWYNGYSFDGLHQCYNPYPVLAALEAGKLTRTEMDGTSGTNWLGLLPEDVLRGMMDELGGASIPVERVSSVNIANLQLGSIHVTSLLLQTGLLTLSSTHGSLAASEAIRCEIPNEYARESLKAMLEAAMKSTASISTRKLWTEIVTTLMERDRAAFGNLIKTFFRSLPTSIIKRGSVEAREAPYHAALWAVLKICVPTSLATVVPEYQVGGARADLAVIFAVQPSQPDETWIFEIGVNTTMKKKMKQVQQLKKAFEDKVTCCTIVVRLDKKGTTAVTIGWAV